MTTWGTRGRKTQDAGHKQGLKDTGENTDAGHRVDLETQDAGGDVKTT